MQKIAIVSSGNARQKLTDGLAFKPIVPFVNLLQLGDDPIVEV
jgi:hypothetical protein